MPSGLPAAHGQGAPSVEAFGPPATARPMGLLAFLPASGRLAGQFRAHFRLLTCAELRLSLDGQERKRERGDAYHRSGARKHQADKQALLGD